MIPIDPAFYRTELCLAINGDWYLMRDGGTIARLPAIPDQETATGVIAARVWANDELARQRISIGGWLNGMDLPPADSGYWVTEPWEDAAATAMPAGGVTP